MVNQVDLPPSHWYALQKLSNEMGYFSRQKLVEAVLIKFLERYPDAIMKGVEEEELRALIKSGARGPKAVDEIIIPLRKAPEPKKKEHDYVFYLKDGSVLEARAAFPGWALNIALGKEVSLQERDELVRDWDIKSE